MLNRLKKNNEGFTIIEVMIVLAIAGLIILIVLLAVPALQRNSRNTAIKNDASVVAGAVGEFASNNDGATPTAADSDCNAEQTGPFNITNATAGATVSPAKVQGGTVSICTQATVTAITPDSGHLYIDFGAKCGAIAATTVTPVKQGRATAIIYAIETSGALKAQCLDT
jgi:prepilin-type N-terminal cleavage/methylation domain-containing protein